MRILHLATLSLVLILLALPSPIHATIQIVTGEGEYRLGDRDTKEDAVRLATEAAKRHALEQVASYIESVTVADGTNLTRDEIRTYTAGGIVITEQQVTSRLEGDAMVVHVELVGEVDPEEVTQAVLALRQNEDARQQLEILRKEVDSLHEQLAEATTKLQAAASPEDVQLAAQQRQETLSHLHSDELLAQAWTDWALQTDAAGGPAMGAASVQGLFSQAWIVYPTNPHLVVLQQRLPVTIPTRVPQPATTVLPPPRPRAVSPLTGIAAAPALPAPRYLRPRQDLHLPPGFRQPQPGRSPMMQRPFNRPSGPGPRFHGGGGHGRGRR